MDVVTLEFGKHQLVVTVAADGAQNETVLVPIPVDVHAIAAGARNRTFGDQLFEAASDASRKSLQQYRRRSRRNKPAQMAARLLRRLRPLNVASKARLKT
ncbi:MAG TPA: hypothetical protein VM915_05345, partial [Verrucomicrobiae bacterium]|nr:hypothetical protein [Verrucomicrobiae bacterium]